MINENSRQIYRLTLQDYGTIKDFFCPEFSRINLIIGENGTGKTSLMKAMYSGIKTLEDYKRGNDTRSVNDILAEKLRWTFQVNTVGDLVCKDAGRFLVFRMDTKSGRLYYGFRNTTQKEFPELLCESDGRKNNSVYIPAKEILSLYSIILKSRDIDKSFGFDDTYYDLAKALQASPKTETESAAYKKALKQLGGMIGGSVSLDESRSEWSYKKGRKTISIGMTSEGIKKLAILTRLLSNGYLGEGSVVFIDELESSLHPSAISKFLEIIDGISKAAGIQFFIASHSYFVIKKLCLLAKADGEPMTCISLSKDPEHPVTITDLSEGMPENSIINESIRLYEEEIDLVLED